MKQIPITVSKFTFEHFHMNEYVVKFNTDSCKCFLLLVLYNTCYCDMYQQFFHLQYYYENYIIVCYGF